MSVTLQFTYKRAGSIFTETLTLPNAVKGNSEGLQNNLIIHKTYEGRVYTFRRKITKKLIMIFNQITTTMRSNILDFFEKFNFCQNLFDYITECSDITLTDWRGETYTVLLGGQNLEFMELTTGKNTTCKLYRFTLEVVDNG